MDFTKFLHIAVWVVAIISTILFLLQILLWWYETFTPAGKMSVLREQMYGYRRSFLLRIPVIMLFAWIAVFCLN